jgi:hypothetical protein
MDKFIGLHLLADFRPRTTALPLNKFSIRAKEFFVMKCDRKRVA